MSSSHVPDSSVSKNGVKAYEFQLGDGKLDPTKGSRKIVFTVSYPLQLEKAEEITQCFYSIFAKEQTLLESKRATDLGGKVVVDIRGYDEGQYLYEIKDRPGVRGAEPKVIPGNFDEAFRVHEVSLKTLGQGDGAIHSIIDALSYAFSLLKQPIAGLYKLASSSLLQKTEELHENVEMLGKDDQKSMLSQIRFVQRLFENVDEVAKAGETILKEEEEKAEADRLAKAHPQVVAPKMTYKEWFEDNALSAKEYFTGKFNQTKALGRGWFYDVPEDDAAAVDPKSACQEIAGSLKDAYEIGTWIIAAKTAKSKEEYLKLVGLIEDKFALLRKGELDRLIVPVGIGEDVEYVSHFLIFEGNDGTVKHVTLSAPTLERSVVAVTEYKLTDLFEGGLPDKELPPIYKRVLDAAKMFAQGLNDSKIDHDAPPIRRFIKEIIGISAFDDFRCKERGRTPFDLVNLIQQKIGSDDGIDFRQLNPFEIINYFTRKKGEGPATKNSIISRLLLAHAIKSGPNPDWVVEEEEEIAVTPVQSSDSEDEVRGISDEDDDVPPPVIGDKEEVTVGRYQKDGDERINHDHYRKIVSYKRTSKDPVKGLYTVLSALETPDDEKVVGVESPLDSVLQSKGAFYTAYVNHLIAMLEENAEELTAAEQEKIYDALFIYGTKLKNILVKEIGLEAALQITDPLLKTVAEKLPEIRERKEREELQGAGLKSRITLFSSKLNMKVGEAWDVMRPSGEERSADGSRIAPELWQKLTQVVAPNITSIRAMEFQLHQCGDELIIAKAEEEDDLDLDLIEKLETREARLLSQLERKKELLLESLEELSLAVEGLIASGHPRPARRFALALLEQIPVPLKSDGTTDFFWETLREEEECGRWFDVVALLTEQFSEACALDRHMPTTGPEIALIRIVLPLTLRCIFDKRSSIIKDEFYENFLALDPAEEEDAKILAKLDRLKTEKIEKRKNEIKKEKLKELKAKWKTQNNQYAQDHKALYKQPLREVQKWQKEKRAWDATYAKNEAAVLAGVKALPGARHFNLLESVNADEYDDGFEGDVDAYIKARYYAEMGTLSSREFAVKYYQDYLIARFKQQHPGVEEGIEDDIRRVQLFRGLHPDATKETPPTEAKQMARVNKCFSSIDQLMGHFGRDALTFCVQALDNPAGRKNLNIYTTASQVEANWPTHAGSGFEWTISAEECIRIFRENCTRPQDKKLTDDQILIGMDYIIRHDNEGLEDDAIAANFDRMLSEASAHHNLDVNFATDDIEGLFDAAYDASGGYGSSSDQLAAAYKFLHPKTQLDDNDIYKLQLYLYTQSSDELKNARDFAYIVDRGLYVLPSSLSDLEKAAKHHASAADKAKMGQAQVKKLHKAIKTLRARPADPERGEGPGKGPNGYKYELTPKQYRAVRAPQREREQIRELNAIEFRDAKLLQLETLDFTDCDDGLPSTWDNIGDYELRGEIAKIIAEHPDKKAHYVTYAYWGLNFGTDFSFAAGGDGPLTVSDFSNPTHLMSQDRALLLATNPAIEGQYLAARHLITKQFKPEREQKLALASHDGLQALAPAIKEILEENPNPPMFAAPSEYDLGIKGIEDRELDRLRREAPGAAAGIPDPGEFTSAEIMGKVAAIKNTLTQFLADLDDFHAAHPSQHFSTNDHEIVQTIYDELDDLEDNWDDWGDADLGDENRGITNGRIEKIRDIRKLLLQLSCRGLYKRNGDGVSLSSRDFHLMFVRGYSGKKKAKTQSNRLVGGFNTEEEGLENLVPKEISALARVKVWGETLDHSTVTADGDQSNTFMRETWRLSGQVNKQLIDQTVGKMSRVKLVFAKSGTCEGFYLKESQDGPGTYFVPLGGTYADTSGKTRLHAHYAGNVQTDFLDTLVGGDKEDGTDGRPLRDNRAVLREETLAHAAQKIGRKASGERPTDADRRTIGLFSEVGDDIERVKLYGIQVGRTLRAVENAATIGGDSDTPFSFITVAAAFEFIYQYHERLGDQESVRHALYASLFKRGLIRKQLEEDPDFFIDNANILNTIIREYVAIGSDEARMTALFLLTVCGKINEIALQVKNEAGDDVEKSKKMEAVREKLPGYDRDHQDAVTGLFSRFEFDRNQKFFAFYLLAYFCSNPPEVNEETRDLWVKIFKAHALFERSPSRAGHPGMEEEINHKFQAVLLPRIEPFLQDPVNAEHKKYILNALLGLDGGEELDWEAVDGVDYQYQSVVPPGVDEEPMVIDLVTGASIEIEISHISRGLLPKKVFDDPNVIRLFEGLGGKEKLDELRNLPVNIIAAQVEEGADGKVKTDSIQRYTWENSGINYEIRFNVKTFRCQVFQIFEGDAYLYQTPLLDDSTISRILSFHNRTIENYIQLSDDAAKSGEKGGFGVWVKEGEKDKAYIAPNKQNLGVNPICLHLSGRKIKEATVGEDENKKWVVSGMSVGRVPVLSWIAASIGGGRNELLSFRGVGGILLLSSDKKHVDEIQFPLSEVARAEQDKTKQLILIRDKNGDWVVKGKEHLKWKLTGTKSLEKRFGANYRDFLLPLMNEHTGEQEFWIWPHLATSLGKKEDSPRFIKLKALLSLPQVAKFGIDTTPIKFGVDVDGHEYGSHAAFLYMGLNAYLRGDYSLAIDYLDKMAQRGDSKTVEEIQAFRQVSMLYILAMAEILFTKKALRPKAFTTAQKIFALKFAATVSRVHFPVVEEVALNFSENLPQPKHLIMIFSAALSPLYFNYLRKLPSKKHELAERNLLLNKADIDALEKVTPPLLGSIISIVGEFVVEPTPEPLRFAMPTERELKILKNGTFNLNCSKQMSKAELDKKFGTDLRWETVVANFSNYMRWINKNSVTLEELSFLMKEVPPYEKHYKEVDIARRALLAFWHYKYGNSDPAKKVEKKIPHEMQSILDGFYELGTELPNFMDMERRTEKGYEELVEFLTSFLNELDVSEALKEIHDMDIRGAIQKWGASGVYYVAGYFIPLALLKGRQLLAHPSTKTMENGEVVTTGHYANYCEDFDRIFHEINRVNSLNERKTTEGDRTHFTMTPFETELPTDDQLDERTAEGDENAELLAHIATNMVESLGIDHKRLLPNGFDFDNFSIEDIFSDELMKEAFTSKKVWNKLLEFGVLGLADIFESELEKIPAGENFEKLAKQKLWDLVYRRFACIYLLYNLKTNGGDFNFVDIPPLEELITQFGGGDIDPQTESMINAIVSAPRNQLGHLLGAKDHEGAESESRDLASTMGGILGLLVKGVTGGDPLGALGGLAGGGGPAGGGAPPAGPNPVADVLDAVGITESSIRSDCHAIFEPIFLDTWRRFDKVRDQKILDTTAPGIERAERATVRIGASFAPTEIKPGKDPETWESKYFTEIDTSKTWEKRVKSVNRYLKANPDDKPMLVSELKSKRKGVKKSAKELKEKTNRSLKIEEVEALGHHIADRIIYLDTEASLLKKDIFSFARRYRSTLKLLHFYADSDRFTEKEIFDRILFMYENGELNKIGGTDQQKKLEELITQFLLVSTEKQQLIKAQETQADLFEVLKGLTHQRKGELKLLEADKRRIKSLEKMVIGLQRAVLRGAHTVGIFSEDDPWGIVADLNRAAEAKIADHLVDALGITQESLAPAVYAEFTTLMNQIMEQRRLKETFMQALEDPDLSEERRGEINAEISVINGYLARLQTNLSNFVNTHLDATQQTARDSMGQKAYCELTSLVQSKIDLQQHRDDLRLKMQDAQDTIETSTDQEAVDAARQQKRAAKAELLNIANALNGINGELSALAGVYETELSVTEVIADANKRPSNARLAKLIAKKARKNPKLIQPEHAMLVKVCAQLEQELNELNACKTRLARGSLDKREAVQQLADDSVNWIINSYKLLTFLKEGADRLRYAKKIELPDGVVVWRMQQPNVYRKFLIHDWRNGFIVRAKAEKAVDDIINKGSLFVKVRMGIGKSTFIFPMLTRLFMERGKQPVLMTTEVLLPQLKEFMDKSAYEFRFNINYGFDQTTLDAIKNPDAKQKFIVDHLVNIKNNLESLKASGRSVMTTPARVAFLRDKRVQIQEELITLLEEGDRASRRRAMERLQLVKEIEAFFKGDDIIFLQDEDVNLDISFEYNFAVKSSARPVDKIQHTTTKKFIELMLQNPILRKYLLEDDLRSVPNAKLVLEVFAKRMLEDESFVEAFWTHPDFAAFKQEDWDDLTTTEAMRDVLIPLREARKELEVQLAKPLDERDLDAIADLKSDIASYEEKLANLKATEPNPALEQLLTYLLGHNPRIATLQAELTDKETWLTAELELPELEQDADAIALATEQIRDLKEEIAQLEATVDALPGKSEKWRWSMDQSDRERNNKCYLASVKQLLTLTFNSTYKAHGKLDRGIDRDEGVQVVPYHNGKQKPMTQFGVETEILFHTYLFYLSSKGAKKVDLMGVKAQRKFQQYFEERSRSPEAQWIRWCGNLNGRARSGDVFRAFWQKDPIDVQIVPYMRKLVELDNRRGEREELWSALQTEITRHADFEDLDEGVKEAVRTADAATIAAWEDGDYADLLPIITALKPEITRMSILVDRYSAKEWVTVWDKINDHPLYDSLRDDVRTKIEGERFTSWASQGGGIFKSRAEDVQAAEEALKKDLREDLHLFAQILEDGGISVKTRLRPFLQKVQNMSVEDWSATRVLIKQHPHFGQLGEASAAALQGDLESIKAFAKLDENGLAKQFTHDLRTMTGILEDCGVEIGGEATHPSYLDRLQYIEYILDHTKEVQIYDKQIVCNSQTVTMRTKTHVGSGTGDAYILNLSSPDNDSTSEPDDIAGEYLLLLDLDEKVDVFDDAYTYIKELALDPKVVAVVNGDYDISEEGNLSERIVEGLRKHLRANGKKARQFVYRATPKMNGGERKRFLWNSESSSPSVYHPEKVDQKTALGYYGTEDGTGVDFRLRADGDSWFVNLEGINSETDTYFQRKGRSRQIGCGQRIRTAIDRKMERRVKRIVPEGEALTEGWVIRSVIEHSNEAKEIRSIKAQCFHIQEIRKKHNDEVVAEPYNYTPEEGLEATVLEDMEAMCHLATHTDNISDSSINWNRIYSPMQKVKVEQFLGDSYERELLNNDSQYFLFLNMLFQNCGIKEVLETDNTPWMNRASFDEVGLLTPFDAREAKRKLKEDALQQKAVSGAVSSALSGAKFQDEKMVAAGAIVGGIIGGISGFFKGRGASSTFSKLLGDVDPSLGRDLDAAKMRGGIRLMDAGKIDGYMEQIDQFKKGIVELADKNIVFRAIFNSTAEINSLNIRDPEYAEKLALIDAKFESRLELALKLLPSDGDHARGKRILSREAARKIYGFVRAHHLTEKELRKGKQGLMNPKVMAYHKKNLPPEIGRAGDSDSERQTNVQQQMQMEQQQQMEMEQQMEQENEIREAHILPDQPPLDYDTFKDNMLDEGTFLVRYPRHEGRMADERDTYISLGRYLQRSLVGSRQIDMRRNVSDKYWKNRLHETFISKRAANLLNLGSGGPLFYQIVIKTPGKMMRSCFVTQTELEQTIGPALKMEKEADDGTEVSVLAISRGDLGAMTMKSGAHKIPMNDKCINLLMLNKFFISYPEYQPRELTALIELMSQLKEHTRDRDFPPDTTPKELYSSLLQIMLNMNKGGRIHKNWSLELVKDLIGLDMDILKTIAGLKNADALRRQANKMSLQAILGKLAEKSDDELMEIRGAMMRDNDIDDCGNFWSTLSNYGNMADLKRELRRLGGMTSQWSLQGSLGLNDRTLNALKDFLIKHGAATSLRERAQKITLKKIFSLLAEKPDNRFDDLLIQLERDPTIDDHGDFAGILRECDTDADRRALIAELADLRDQEIERRLNLPLGGALEFRIFLMRHCGITGEAQETANIGDTRGLLDLEKHEMKEVMMALSKIYDSYGEPLVQLSATANFSQGQARIDLLSQLSWNQFVQLRAVFDKWKKGLLGGEESAVVEKAPRVHRNGLRVKQSKAAGVLRNAAGGVFGQFKRKEAPMDDIDLKWFFDNLVENYSAEEIQVVYDAIIADTFAESDEFMTAKGYFEAFPNMMESMGCDDVVDFAEAMASRKEDQLRTSFGLGDIEGRERFLDILANLPAGVYNFPVAEESSDSDDIDLDGVTFDFDNEDEEPHF